MDYLDAELVNRVRQGDERAFETVYRRYYEMLCRFSAQLLHNPAMAEEVVDDVLFHIWDARAQLEVSSLRAYLVRAVRNNSLKAVSSPAYQNEKKAVSLSAEGLRFSEFLSDDVHPLGWVIEREMEKQLTEAMAILPEECRRVFRMSRFEGKKYAEIADALGISVNTVKYHIKNAIRQLSKHITPCLLVFALLPLQMNS